MQPPIIKSKYSPGVYFVKDQEWKVGERYEVLHLLGSGSFSSVCCALDKTTGEKVALKRIPDILSSPELARRVLREICILRRLRHPFIITLLDAFLTPSSTGQYKMVDGELKATSLDCYLAMELGEDGDLFNLRGQLSAEEVRLLTWQILHSLKYLHALNVWHRDVKSSNVMLGRKEGHKMVKLADFGSSRSATQEGYHFAEQGAPEPRYGGLRMPFSRQVIQTQKAQHERGEVPGSFDPIVMDTSKDYGTPGGGAQPVDLYVQLGNEQKRGGGVGFCSPLTRVVATPCYRAPEVVMSRGGYTSSVDMWSVGCILGELLQRAPRVGSADTPHLKIAPLFAIHAGILKTPEIGDRWDNKQSPGDLTTRSELLALFNVIGTPSWSDAERVQAPEWRRYLQRLPGRAPTLFRRFSFAGEVAVHLLSRLLAFDPERRCSAEEALQHEFFSGLESNEDVETSSDVWDGSLVGNMEGVHLSTLPSAPADEPLLQSMRSDLEAAWEEHAAKKSKLSSPEPSLVSPEKGRDRDEVMQQYSSDPDAARALALLESEMVGGDAPADQIKRLRTLLEKECQAQAQQSLSGEGGSMRHSPHWPSHQVPASHRKQPSNPSMGLQVDDGEDPDPSKLGPGRLSNTADTWAAKLDTAAHLRPGRHGEWTPNSGQGPVEGYRWGVSSTPPGGQSMDPRMREIIRSQQLR